MTPSLISNSSHLISSHPIKTGSLYLHLLSFDFHVIEMHQYLSMFTHFSLMTSSWNSSMLLLVLSLFLSFHFSFIFSFPNIFRFQTLSTSVYILSWEAMVLVERFKLEWISMARLSFYNMKPWSNKPAIRVLKVHAFCCTRTPSEFLLILSMKLLLRINVYLNKDYWCNSQPVQPYSQDSMKKRCFVFCIQWFFICTTR